MTLNQYRILIVDDNPAFIKAFEILIRTVLASKLELIDIANNGIEALEKVNSNSYDFIFMDVNMPQMDGIMATKLINREFNRFTKIIAISFNSDFQTVSDMLHSGARGYINKANITYDEVVKIFEQNFN
jgi:CheY-like chemotaxis protein